MRARCLCPIVEPYEEIKPICAPVWPELRYDTPPYYIYTAIPGRDVHFGLLDFPKWDSNQSEAGKLFVSLDLYLYASGKVKT